MAGRKKPRALRAFAKVYGVRYCDPNTIKLEGEVCEGLTVHQTQQIHVERGMTPDNEADTLIHEHLHQLLRPLHASVMPGDDLEEALCQHLAPAIFASMRENPDYWRYLMSIAVPRRQKKRPLTPKPESE